PSPEMPPEGEAPPAPAPSPETPPEGEAPPAPAPSPETPPEGEAPPAPTERAPESAHEPLGAGASGSEQAAGRATAAEPPEPDLGSTASEVLAASAANAESGVPPALAPTELAPVNPASLTKSDSSEHSAAASTVRGDSESFGCGLNMPGGPWIGKCAPGWDAAATVSAAAAPVALLARAASLARATADGPNDGGRGGSADRSPPENPPPSQAPSGAAVGGAAVGGVGSATSAFLTLM